MTLVSRSSETALLDTLPCHPALADTLVLALVLVIVIVTDGRSTVFPVK
jgi:hypothetical protein